VTALTILKDAKIESLESRFARLKAAMHLVNVETTLTAAALMILMHAWL
jgi:hypothetical protein